MSSRLCGQVEENWGVEQEFILETVVVAEGTEKFTPGGKHSSLILPHGE